MSSPNESCWGLIIQTNEYAGNFERDLCAHCTGQIGDCGVGDDYIDKAVMKVFGLNDSFDADELEDYDEDYEEEEIIMSVADDHGCYRPCSIYQNEAKAYNDVIIYFYNKPTAEQIKMVKDRAATFNEVRKTKRAWNNDSNIQMLNYKIIHIEIKTTETIENV
jgi:hypothetical protein